MTLIAVLMSLVLTGPTVNSLTLSETPREIRLEMKVRERVIPEFEQWWKGGFYRLRIRGARFSSRLKVYRGSDSAGILTFERRFDPKGATVRIRFRYSKERVLPALAVDTYRGGLRITVDKVALGYTPPPDTNVSQSSGAASSSGTPSSVSAAQAGTGQSPPVPVSPSPAPGMAPPQHAVMTKEPASAVSSGIRNSGSTTNVRKNTVMGSMQESSSDMKSPSGSKLGEEVRKVLREGSGSTGDSSYGSGSSATWGSTLLLLFILGLIAGGSYYFLRKLQGPLGSSDEIRVVARSSIGPGLQVVIVEVRGRQLVVGISGNQMNLLTELSPDIETEGQFAADEELAGPLPSPSGVVPESIQGILALKKNKKQDRTQGRPSIESEFYQGAGLEDDDEE